MKKILYLFVATLLFFSACHKDDSPPANAVVADIDGVTTTFAARVYAERKDDSDDASGPYVSVYACIDNSQPGVILAFLIQNGKAISTGTYTADPGNLKHSATISYSGTYVASPFTTDFSQPNATTIRVTSITGTSIQGTFSGQLKGYYGEKKITNGRFNVNF